MRGEEGDHGDGEGQRNPQRGHGPAYQHRGHEAGEGERCEGFAHHAAGIVDDGLPDIAGNTRVPTGLASELLPVGEDEVQQEQPDE